MNKNNSFSAYKNKNQEKQPCEIQQYIENNMREKRS